MAFDGFTTAALARELAERLTGGRVYRIIQPEQGELLLTIRPEISRGGGQVRLVLSADATLPLVYLTPENKPAPETAPAFCMLLRKYLQNGRIVSVAQPGLERILRFEIEHFNEMGDLCRHTLVIELMGRHSNIILLNGETIVDAIKHIPASVSSVREVLPGRSYFVPETQGKTNPFEETPTGFRAMLCAEHIGVPQLLQRHYNGFSVRMSEEVVFRAHLMQDRCGSDLTDEEQARLWEAFSGVLSDVRAGHFHPTIYYHVGAADTLSQGEPVDYAALPLTMFRNLPAKEYDSISVLIENYYREKNALTRIRQKSADLRRTVQTILERDLHKYDLQTRQLQETNKRDRYRLYGELLNVYGYGIPEGAASAELENYYTGEMVTVPLDPTKTAAENAQHYYNRYTKLKRTKEALEVLMKDVRAEIDQLQEIRAALDLSVTEADLAQIREEMELSGFLHRRTDAKGRGKGDSRPSAGKSGQNGAKGSRDASRTGRGRRLPAAKPLHYLSSDGYDIYVGKNNLQNDDLTFRIGKPSDIWFHANDMPGSHVLLRTNGTPFEEVPDRAFEEAARLAAWYSTGRDAGRVEVDYLERRNVKKPSGARPGFVVYYTNYSINVRADIAGIKPVNGSD